MAIPSSFSDNEEDEAHLSRVIGERVRQQFREASSQRAGEAAYVMCGCAMRTPLLSVVKCAFCYEFLCIRCAGIHFGEGRVGCAKGILDAAKATAILAALEVAALFA